MLPQPEEPVLLLHFQHFQEVKSFAASSEGNLVVNAVFQHSTRAFPLFSDQSMCHMFPHLLEEI